MRANRMIRVSLGVAFLLAVARAGAGPEVEAHHVKVYYEKGRFGGWPANYGMWSWGDEILVGFSRGYYKDLGPTRHHIDRERPEVHMLARSLDGGETWTIEDPNSKGYLIGHGEALHGTESPELKIPRMKTRAEPIDFSHPDFAMTVRMTDINSGPSWYSYSYDRGRTWEGPFALPNFGAPGIAARTDYVIDGPSRAMLFLTAAKSDKKEGRPLCVETTDGGMTWNFVSWIGPEPKGYSIMPSSVRLSETGLVTTLRRREWGPDRSWIDLYGSSDNGRTWKFMNEPVEDTGEGNPPSLIKLADGRLCLTYGVRKAPWRICAKLSGDGGKTWGEEITLRGDGTDRDVGYCRSIQRPDGKVVTTYYFNDPATGPERYIGATIWKP